MDFTNIFNGESLTLEQFHEKTKEMKLADLSGGEYVAKGKYEADTKRLQDDLTSAKETISILEASKGDTDAIRAELEKYKNAEADRKKAEEEAQADAVLTQAAEMVLEGKDFINEYTKAHFVNELKKAMADPGNKGKKAADLFSAMTKDVDGIYKNPQQEPMKLKKVENHNGKPMTREEIMKITDAAKRQAAIAEHMELFQNRKDD